MAHMTIERLHQLFEDNPHRKDLIWQGTCHDCKSPVTVSATPKPDGIHIHGGGVFEPKQDQFFLKCESCFAADPVLKNYQDCEVYSRVVGYLRPVAQWNDGKQSEFADRKVFSV